MSAPPLPPSPPPRPDWHAAVSAALGILRAGGLVAYPTETVWGLAAHPDHPEAVRRLRTDKGSAVDKPLQVSCASAELARRLARPDGVLDALSGFWPGPLTVVTPSSPRCPPHFAPGGKVGLRVPAHVVAQSLVERAGGYLLTTSCNRSGAAPARTREEAEASGLAELTLPDGGVPAGGQASTVVLLPGGVILRQGSVTEEQLRALLRRASGATPTGDQA